MKKVVIMCSVFLILGFSFSCTPKKGKKLTTTPIEEAPVSIFTPPAEVVEEEPPPPAEPIPEPVIEEPPAPYIVASLKKTPCYGQCPAFEAKVYSDGKVVYMGSNHVDKVGYFEAQVDDQFVTTLMAKAGEINFLALSSNYPTNGRNISDIPSTISYLNVNNQEKTITNNFDSPIALRRYERYFVDLLNQLQWKKVQ